jgi:fucose 4-O-acetylase-like acetyltransferase
MHNGNTADTRADWVDYAKAIGILLVVYAHTMRGLFRAELDIPIAFYQVSDSIVYSFHMPLFFFLSGLFFYSSFSRHGGKKLVLGKLDTIFYPYLLWSILQGVLEFAMDDYTNRDISYGDLVSILWSPRAQFWYLYALLMIFVLATAIFSVTSKKSVFVVFLIAALAYACNSLLPHELFLNFINQNFVFFVLGMLFTLRVKATDLSSSRALGLTALVFIAGQYLFHDTLALHYTDKGPTSLVLAIASIVFVVSLSSWIAQRPNRLLALIGSSSLAIFLMHVITGSGTRIVLHKFLGLESFYIHLIAGFSAAVIAPLLAVWVIDKLNIKYVFSAPLSKLLVPSGK